jgi:WD40 repeat protein
VGIENWTRLFTWDSHSNRRQVIEEHAIVGPPNSLAISRDERLIAYSTRNGQVVLWDLSAGRPKSVIKPRAAGLFLMAFSPDSRLLALAGEGGSAQVWDVETAQPVTDPLLGLLAGSHLAGIWKVSFSADSRSLVTYCGDYTAKVWNVATGREMLSGLPLSNFLVSHPSWHLLAGDGNSVVESAGTAAIRVVRLPTLAEIDAIDKSGKPLE